MVLDKPRWVELDIRLECSAIWGWPKCGKFFFFFEGAIRCCHEHEKNSLDNEGNLNGYKIAALVQFEYK